MALLYGRAGRLTAKNGGFRPGQEVNPGEVVEEDTNPKKKEGQDIDPDIPGNLGPYVLLWGPAENVSVVEGSPFTTATVPLQLRRAIYVEDMVTVRGYINAHRSFHPIMLMGLA